MMKATASFILMTLFSVQAMAAGFDFLPAGAGPEKEFKSQLSSGDYHQALTTWPSAHGNSAFGHSEAGAATYAYLLYKNAMPYLALEILVQRTRPANLGGELLKLWTAELKTSVYIQKGWIQTLGGWRQIVNNEPVVLKLKSKKDVSSAFARYDKLPKDQVNARARILWAIANQAPQISDTTSALKALKLLSGSTQTVYGHDLVASVYGRALYQAGNIDAAIASFQQIPKGSSLWVESVEERAWGHLRKDDYDQALGEVTTLMSPVLAPLVGPESYFLSNLMSLKVCDYNRLFKTSELFKKRQRDRLVAIQDLAIKGDNKNLSSALAKFDLGGVSVETAGPMVHAVPRQAFRDAKFVRYLESRRELLLEAKQASELGPEFTRYATNAQNKADSLKQLANQRVRVLAQVEYKEFRTILNKMHIVEAEVIERLHLDENLKGQRSKLSKVEDKGDVLVFPVNTNEAWLDELDNYKARVKDCPTLKGASL